MMYLESIKKYRAYLPNTITGARIFLTLIYIILVLDQFMIYATRLPFAVVVAVFAAICLSDILDGKLARAFNAQSEFGAKIDVAADLFFILSSCIVLNCIGLMPLWFTCIVMLKFIEFTWTSQYLNGMYGAGKVFVFDKPGRFTAIMFYLIPIIGLLMNRFDLDTYGLFDVVLLATAFIAAVSTIFRCISCISVYNMSKKINSTEAIET